MAAPSKSLLGTFLENGRAYGSFQRYVVQSCCELRILTGNASGQYLLPCDITERDRLDIMHTLFKTAREKSHRLLHAPFDEDMAIHRSGQKPRILDLGCGTGIWLIEMSEKFQNTELLGVDLHAMGPASLPDNVEMRPAFDYETPWALGEATWDIVHLQMALGSVSSWPHLYSKILTHLKPGTGWFESVEIDWEPRCDDGTLRPGRLTEWWFPYVSRAYDGACRPLRYNPNMGEDLEAAGFKDVQHRQYRIPLNGWSTDRVEHRSGMWWNIAMSSGQGDGGHGMDALSLAPLTRFNNWSESDARRLVSEALEQAVNPNVHAYNVLHVWWARAPFPGE